MIVYQITNTVNGKIYIGRTAKSVRQRFAEHIQEINGTRPLSRAIREYGPENFTIEMLARCNSRSELITLEKQYIVERGAAFPERGYNVSHKTASGIIGPKSSATSRQATWRKKQIDAGLASVTVWVPPEAVEKIRILAAAMCGALQIRGVANGIPQE